VTLPAFVIARRRGRTPGGAPISLPHRWPPDVGLIACAALFGVGLGLAGIGPGPARVLLGQEGVSALLFAATVAFGAALVDLIGRPGVRS